MNLIYRTVFCLVLFCAVATQAQLAVTVSPPRIFGQKAVVKLAIENGLPGKIETARAVCFLLDDQGKMVGQSTKWVIGQNKAALDPGATSTFNFVISDPKPFTTTNLTPKVSFSRVVMTDGKLADLRRDVTVVTATK
jgi:hypothetical protein